MSPRPFDPDTPATGHRDAVGPDVPAAVGLGLAALGRPGYLNVGHADDVPGRGDVATLGAHSRTMLRHAYLAGVRWFDAARSYGRAEEFLATWLRRHPAWARSVTVSSKWGYRYTADWRVDVGRHEVKDHSRAAFERQLERTRALLGEHLDLYQIHSATPETGVLEDAGIAAGLRDLAGEGVRIGLTLSGPEQARTLERAVELADTGRVPFTSVQATWNPLEPSVGPALSAAHARGWTVIIKETMANGRLSPRGDPPAEMRRAAAAHGVGVDTVAVALALAQPFSDVVLTGAATTAQLDSHLRASEVRLSAEERVGLLDAAEAPGAYWTRRSALPWT